MARGHPGRLLVAAFVFVPRFSALPRYVSLLRKEPFVIVVVAYPKPCDRVTSQNAESSVPTSNSDRPDVLILIDALEVQGGVKRILRPQSISFPGAAPSVVVKHLVCRPKGRQGGRLHSSS